MGGLDLINDADENGLGGGGWKQKSSDDMMSLYEMPTELLDLKPPRSSENVLGGLIDRELEVSDLGGTDELLANCVNLWELS